MTHVPGIPVDGDFTAGWTTCDAACPNCSSRNTEYRTWESSDGGWEDYKYHCKDCGTTWWIDGIDS